MGWKKEKTEDLKDFKSRIKRLNEQIVIQRGANLKKIRLKKN